MNTSGRPNLRLVDEVVVRRAAAIALGEQDEQLQRDRAEAARVQTFCILDNAVRPMPLSLSHNVLTFYRRLC